MTKDDSALWDMVCASRTGILGTIGSDGMPHLTNVNYLADADERVVRFTTTTDRAKGRNLLRDPRVTLHAQGPDAYHFAVVAGPVRTAVAEAVGDAAIDELHDLIEELRGPAERPAFDEEMLSNHRMLVELSVERIYGLIPPKRRSR